MGQRERVSGGAEGKGEWWGRGKGGVVCQRERVSGGAEGKGR